MSIRNLVTIASYLSLFLNVFLPLESYSQELAKVFSVEGEVKLKKFNANDWILVTSGAKLDKGDTVQTTQVSRAGILFSDGILIRLNQNTSFEIQSQSETEQNVSVQSGEAYFFSRKPRRFPSVATSTVHAAVRGTEFIVKAGPKSSEIAVLDGSVLCSNSKGEVSLAGGERATTDKDKPPIKSIIVDVAGEVQWALYYPDIVGEVSLGGSEKDLKFVKSASRLLSSGQVDESERLLSQIKSDSAERSALKAIVLVTKGERDLALKEAEKAVSFNHNSVPALIALSYVEQARFNLDGALDAINKALLIDDSNSFVLARIAQLQLSSGAIDEAVSNAEKAFELSPRNSHALTTLGFAYLTSYKAAEAQSFFERGIEVDQSQGLSHLGLGLALIHQGHLEQGRLELQKAAFLEPNVSLYRSYLGKAFFEEEKEEESKHEYERAIALDPEDPTPYVYRAYYRLSNNQIVEALSDLEDATARNDNRAVYRSRLLLDQDSSTRSAGLSEIFNALGFSSVARIEAIRSINKDYGNYSGHRLLADSYRTAFLSDANLSEKQVSTLMAPLSLNVFSAPGAEASLNEYNALFDRPENRLGINGKATTQDDTLSSDVFATGRTERAGYFLGLQDAYANGSKEGNYLRDYRGRFVGQYQPSYEDRFLVEANSQYRRIEDENSTFDQVRFEHYNLDLGYRRKLSPESTLLTEVSYRNGRDRLGAIEERLIGLNATVDGELIPVDLSTVLDELGKEKLEEGRGSAQYIYQSSAADLILGGELYKAQSQRVEDTQILADDLDLFTGFGTPLPSSSDNAIGSYDSYGYSSIHATDWMDLNFGVNYTELERDEREILPYFDATRRQSKWSPKYGATIYLTPETTFRAAYFDLLRKSNLRDTGSLEPSIVGGINQRFNDFSGTESNNFGFGLDHKFSKSTYLGVETIHRNVSEESSTGLSIYDLNFDSGEESSQTVLGDPIINRMDQDLVRAYLYQVITKQIVSNLDYEFSNGKNNTEGFNQEIESHKSSLGLKYFDPSGAFLFTTGTWRYQDRTGSFFLEDGNNDFWIVDAGVGYRLPKRHGLLTLAFTNIFDREFSYDQSLGFEEFVSPEFATMFRFSVNL